MDRFGIIADDLTGALDCGVQFTENGFETIVLFDEGVLGKKEIHSECDVLILETDSRSTTAGHAYQKVKRAAGFFKSMKVTHLYKKIDSTLRGNLGKEIDAIMDVFSFEFAIIAPAYPSLGRSTLNGHHFLEGIPVAQTELARDPKTPVTESNVVKLLGDQSRRKVALLSKQVIEQGKTAVQEQLNLFKKGSVELIVTDAMENEDLKNIVEFISDYKDQVLWVGSAGLAQYIPLLCQKRDRIPTEARYKAGNVLVVAGSKSSVTYNQIKHFNKQIGVISFEMDAASILDPFRKREEMNQYIEQISQALHKGFDVSITVGEIRISDSVQPVDVASQIANSMGYIASSVIREHHLQGVVLTGGDIAKAVCKQLDIPGISVVREIEPGIPLSRMMNESQLFVVTKAGAFGTETSLSEIRKKLKGER